MARKHRSIPPLSKQDILRFWSKVRIRGLDECWPWTARKERFGYGQFRIRRAKGPCVNTSFTAHRVAWTIANGLAPPNLCVLHRCDCPSCQNPRHLWLGTNADNSHDMVRKGRQARGEQNGWSSLTEQEIRNIRHRYASDGISMRALAREYDVSATHILRIVHRQTWAHVA